MDDTLIGEISANRGDIPNNWRSIMSSEVSDKSLSIDPGCCVDFAKLQQGRIRFYWMRACTYYAFIGRDLVRTFIEALYQSKRQLRFHWWRAYTYYAFIGRDLVRTFIEASSPQSKRCRPC